MPPSNKTSGSRKRADGGAPAHSHSARRRNRRESPALTLDQALEQALNQILTFDRPADRALSEFFRQHRHLGRRDRGLIADRVFDVIRQRRLYAHLAESGSGSHARRLALIADHGQAQSVMRTDAAEQAWLERVATIDRSSLGTAVGYSLPDWLLEGLQAQQIPGEGGLVALAQSLLEPAALDIRANLLKTEAAALAEELAVAGVPTAAVPTERLAEPGTALRVAGHPAFEQLDSFTAGKFEVQDAGSQWVAWRAGARRGEAVVDFCAGAGGKTLAMAAMMRGSGQIYACDTSLSRLNRLKPRLARSGASNVQPLHIEHQDDRRLRRLWGRIDLVLVDAPCSGTGTLRRNPDLKWRQQGVDLERLAALQGAIVQAAARLLKPGGRLIYVTCSLLEQENEAVAHAFEATDDFASLKLERLDLSQPGLVAAKGVAATDPNSGEERENDRNTGFVRLWPHLDESDGFFVAGWRRQPA